MQSKVFVETVPEKIPASFWDTLLCQKLKKGLMKGGIADDLVVLQNPSLLSVQSTEILEI